MRSASHLGQRTRVGRLAIAAGLVATVLLATVVMAIGIGPAGADPPEFVGAPPTVGDFNPVTMNGTGQLTSATITPFVIGDDSGALAGWHVTLLIPDLQNGTGVDCSTGATASIAGANISMDAPLVSAADGLTSLTGVTATGFTDFTTPRTIVGAAAGAGAGTYDVTPGILRLVVPTNTLAGAYCSEATIAITTGP